MVPSTQITERLAFTPRIYQALSLDFILNTPRCALFADIGMGKTISVLTAFDNLLLAGYETKPMLIISTLRVARGVWSKEAAKWAHLRHIEVSTIVGTPEERRAALKRPASVYTVNFENLLWLLDELGDKWPFGMIVVDESTRLRGLRMSIQTSKLGKRYLRGEGALRARKLAKVAYQNKAARWINLSGTPTLNGLNQVYGQVWFQDFGRRLGNSYSAFESRWFKTGYDGYTLEALPGAEVEIKDKIKDICLSIQSEDYLDTKKPVFITVPVSLPEKARRLYQDMKRKLYLEIDGQPVEAFNAASRSIKLLQLCNGAIYLDPDIEDDDTPKAKEWKVVHDRKIEALESIIEECAGDRLIVAYQFKSDLARLKKAFPKARVLKTQKDEDDFKAGHIGLFLMHPESAGHGIDGFQNVCHRIVFWGQWWNTESRNQIIGRIGPVRQFQAGFDRPVYIYDIIAEDTIDEDVVERHTTRASVQATLLKALRRR